MKKHKHPFQLPVGGISGALPSPVTQHSVHQLLSCFMRHIHEFIIRHIIPLPLVRCRQNKVGELNVTGCVHKDCLAARGRRGEGQVCERNESVRVGK